MRCLNTVPRTPGAHNRKEARVYKTNARLCGSDRGGEQQEQHHVPRDL